MYLKSTNQNILHMVVALITGQLPNVLEIVMLKWLDEGYLP